MPNWPEMTHDVSGEPLEEEWLEDYSETDNDPGSLEYNRSQPVRVEFEQTQRVAPETASWSFFQVSIALAVGGTGSFQPTQICPHRYHRYKAKFLWTIPANTTVYLDRVPDRLMSGALGTTFQVTTGATGLVSASVLPDYDGQQPLYAVATNAGVTVSVMDESYKAVQ